MTRINTGGAVPLICEKLRCRIQSGELPPGTRLPTTRQLAKEYGVSLVTMSRAVGCLKKDDLLSAASGSGIFVAFPTASENGGKMPRRRRFAAFIDNWRIRRISPDGGMADYFLHLIDDLVLGIQKRSRELGIETALHLIPVDLYNKPKDYRAFLLDCAKGVDGVLAINVDGFQPVAEAFDVPVVFLHCGTLGEELFRYNVIMPDFYTGAFAITAHLAERGYRRIGCVGGHPDYNPSYTSRLNGFRDALAAHGLPFEESLLFHCNESFYEMMEAANRILALPPELRPDALFCVNDQRAVVLLETFQRRGVQVPQEIALAGFDGSEIATLHQLTTAPQPLLEMGIRGVDTLLMLRESNAVVPLFQLMFHPLSIGKTT